MSPYELVHPAAGGLDNVPPIINEPEEPDAACAIPHRLPLISVSGKPEVLLLGYDG